MQDNTHNYQKLKRQNNLCCPVQAQAHTSSSCFGKKAAWIKYEALRISCRSRCVLNGDVYGQQIGALRRGRESQSPSSRWSDTLCTFPRGAGWIWSADEDDDGVAMWSIIPSVSPLFLFTLPLLWHSSFSLYHVQDLRQEEMIEFSKERDGSCVPFSLIQDWQRQGH